MTTVYYASSLFGAMTLAAGIDEGRFGSGRSLLIVSTNAAVPETVLPVDQAPGFAALRSRFDEVVSWNELIAPLHPSDWRARVIEVPMLERLLAARLRLDGVEELVLESIAVPPARTIAGLIRDCPITVYADGLMSYGPTRDPLPADIFRRITRLLHLDLVPGLEPLLLTEYGVAAESLSGPAFLRVVEQVADTLPEPPAAEAMILGQYLSALDLLTDEEEAGICLALLRGLAARGCRSVAFKPHPSSGRRQIRLMRRAAEEAGTHLVVPDETVPAEVCFAVAPPKLVTGCFSTGLATARTFYGLPVATCGTGLVLERLKPYENSNRIPATIADALFPRLAEDGSLADPPQADLGALVRAVGYCMQPEAHPGLRADAAAYLRRHGQDRYFKRQRLAAVELAPRPGTLARIRRRLARAIT
ncbi:alpha-2,8-polysialyltransferase family protein [Thermoactinospora rubra]|uniref:alpha-2,8-polysialyltransferase family protein n=1 Tax=Thermoactinospora rubra TaxID=1088767 RepID=UPI00197E9C3F|nr:alpha-2,8-polysialyltransferase family protein [Thermoactinospora rubra]